jgi:cytoskeletal protein CcmA (bactofilin family)
VVFRRSTESEKPAEPTPRPAEPGVMSIIAKGMRLKGDCETPGTLRVEGHVTGNVRANRLQIGAGGRVDGDVGGPDGKAPSEAVVIEGTVRGEVKAPRVEVGRDGSVGSGLRVTEAVVRGRVEGPIVAEHRLILEETAVVEGDVTAKRLALKEGGQVAGTIRIGDRAKEA